ncbi:LptA/OstA family protein, partial [uncultured Campylobacter sp.]|uniref:LptA/OstA family protein n=1 Tax=uncultured Campylobacter sp. TaxID=218934 RepID=UPI00261C11E3
MKKSKKFKILALSFSALLANSASAKVQDVELIADNVEKNGFLTEASGNVTVYSQDYFITADRATYDEQNGIIELFGNVNAMRGSSETTRAQHVKIDLKNDKQQADVNFMMTEL